MDSTSTPDPTGQPTSQAGESTSIRPAETHNTAGNPSGDSTASKVSRPPAPASSTAPAQASSSQTLKERARRLILSPPPSGKPPRKGFIYHLEIVFAVAAVLATLFTAWTPGRPSTLFLQPASTRIAQALQPSATAPQGASTSTSVNPRLVGIVAGHWKNDSGAVCPDGLKEVDLNLNIASLVQKLLVAEGYQVELLQERDIRLNGFQAAALVSIHNDSCDFINNEATGFKVAAAFATRHPERAARLTSCLRARYGAITGLPLHSTSVTPDMTSYHAFDEIDENTPAAIIEAGFMNLDRAILTQQPDLVAKGIAAGILCYLRNENISITTPPIPTNAASPTP
jgi:N-acetylmuramoyl-L-alanine amidase